MKILITGNSLTVPLNEAWPAVAESHPGIELDFFVAPHKIFKRFQAQASGDFGLSANEKGQVKGRNWVERLNKRLTVPLADYEVIVVAGLQFGIGPMLKIVSHYRVDGIQTVHVGDRRMSEQAFLALHDDVIAHDLDWLSSFPAGRTLVMPRSRPAEGVAEDDNPGRGFWGAIDAATQDIRATLDFLDRRIADALAARGLTAILQPPETITARGLSRPEFAGGRWLKSGNKNAPAKRDHTHLTTEFGHCLWKPLLAEIARRSR